MCVSVCLCVYVCHTHAGMVDEEERCALVMRYYRNGSVSQVFRNGQYACVPQAARVKFAFQVSILAPCSFPADLHGWV